MPGSSNIHASTRSSSPKEPVGSTCKRAGGGSFGVMRWLARILPTHVKSIKPGGSPRRNSMLALSPGSGDGLPRRLDIDGDSFLIGFKEQSTSVKRVGSNRVVSSPLAEETDDIRERISRLTK